MKRVLIFVVLLSLMLGSCKLLEKPVAGSTSARDAVTVSQNQAASTATQTIPIPQVSYFQERRTIAKWTERWDTPSVAAYLYLISYGRIIGYYVCDGKPASTRSYLAPEETLMRDVDLGEYHGDVIVSAPDIDGTWGQNNPGIRGFTASGIAFEWGGEGATYLYTDTPISLEVPLLGK